MLNLNSRQNIEFIVNRRRRQCKALLQPTLSKIYGFEVRDIQTTGGAFVQGGLALSENQQFVENLGVLGFKKSFTLGHFWACLV